MREDQILSEEMFVGYGDPHDGYIDDAVTRARKLLDNGCEPIAVMQAYGQGLLRIAKLKIWRSAAALELILYLNREFAALYSEEALDRVLA